MAILLFFPFVAPFQTMSSSETIGRYEAVTETEYDITLTLDTTGKARYEFAG